MANPNGMARVEIHCPACGFFMGEVRDYGRLICSKCGCEVTFLSVEERRRRKLEVTDAPPLQTTSLLR